ncbi:MAG: hypothetical protein AAF196_07790 [Planctomycetota bacterium]
MRYDIGTIADLCREIGLRCVVESPDVVDISLEEDVVLRFENLDGSDDCMVSFAGSNWHAHGDLGFCDHRGYNVDLDYLSVITGISDGTILVCEQWKRGALADRWLVHREYVDEFRFLEDGEEIRIRPVVPSGAST